ncbi:MAG: nitrophenyl compound nitroreductase subunit ArsF family protein [Methanoregula sp.]|nr:nitrophenyl compound nitroreductase subunit ArsF family protein [Methanoregula sp.]
MTDIQRIFPIVIFVALIIAISFTAGCTDSSPHLGAAPSAPLSTANTNSTVERVEVYHFHGNSQCTSCIAVGDLAEKTVNDNFKAELASGRLVFAHVNAEKPENVALATKYGVTGSSLWIGVYDANGFYKEENIKVWYLINNKDAYSTYLTNLISKRMNGDLS